MEDNARREAAIFVDEVASAYKRGERSKSLFRIYDKVEVALDIGDTSFVDTLLEVCCVDEIPVSVLLSLLTATLPSRARLSARASFFERVRRRIAADDPNRLKSLLGGLE